MTGMGDFIPPLVEEEYCYFRGLLLLIYVGIYGRGGVVWIILFTNEIVALFFGVTFIF